MRRCDDCQQEADYSECLHIIAEQCIGSAKRIGNWIAPPQAGSLELQAIDYQLLAVLVRFS